MWFLVNWLIKKSPGSRSYGMQPGTFVPETGLEPVSMQRATPQRHHCATLVNKKTNSPA